MYKVYEKSTIRQNSRVLPIPMNSATCSETDRPFSRSEATLVFCYFSEFVLLVKDECNFLIDSPFKLIL